MSCTYGSICINHQSGCSWAAHVLNLDHLEECELAQAKSLPGALGWQSVPVSQCGACAGAGALTNRVDVSIQCLILHPILPPSCSPKYSSHSLTCGTAVGTLPRCGHVAAASSACPLLSHSTALNHNRSHLTEVICNLCIFAVSGFSTLTSSLTMQN